MSQAYNLGKFANTLNTSGQIDVTTGITGTFPTTNLPTIPINKGGTNLTTVGANGTIVSTDGSAYIYGSASGAITWDTVKTSSFTAVAGYGYLVNTTSSTITVTLPSSPSIGQSVVVVDYAGTAATNNIIINPNGSKINSGTGNIIISTNRTGLTLVYIDSTQGWLSQSNVYSGSPPFAQQVPISYLVVAGGGSGGARIGGGGGAGGYLTGTTSLTPSSIYTITIGAGGTAPSGSSPWPVGNNGNNSVLSGTGITTQTAIAGGGGGGYSGIAKSGGSGGGGADGENGYSTAGGTATSGQGNNGGTGVFGSGTYQAGGGGGAGAVGGNAAIPNSGGAGGVGLSNSITGSSVFYAGGGGAGGYNIGGGGVGTGGNGGGGTGVNVNGQTGGAGTANTGGGGGGGPNSGTGGAGGSGVVIISVPTTNYSGTTTGSPTVTTSGSNTIIRFTGSGSYTA